ncbi:MAG: hypothetical protein ABFC63_03855 [Thermoguttaceae bacterium]
MSSLLPTRFLFRFSAPCRYRDPIWPPTGGELDESYRLANLAELEGRTAWADVRAAWNEAGLAMALLVHGKRLPPASDPSRPEQTDGLHVWIDTRDVRNVHRAGRFCHRFAFLAPDVTSDPTARAAAGRSSRVARAPSRKREGGATKCEALFLPIHRARELPRPVAPESLQTRCQVLKDGYFLEALIPADALTGFDPAEHPRLGFAYAVLDRELGEQTFGVGNPMPYREDPSLWATLDLVR